MKLFIPALGTDLRLTEDFTFPLFNEDRNESLIEAKAVKYPPAKHWYSTNDQSAMVTLPAGTVLRVSRIYIRNGQSEFNSMTFFIVGSPDKSLVSKSRGGTLSKAIRFWVKLVHINGVECEVING